MVNLENLPIISLNEVKSGMIALSGGGSFIQRAIRFFTKSEWSHSFMIIDINGIKSVLETSTTISKLAPIERKIPEPDWILVWEPIATEDEKNNALLNAYINGIDKWYAYLSYIWFIWAWFRKLFNKDTNHVWNWASGGIHCTSFTIGYYLMKINPKFNKIFQERDLLAYPPEALEQVMLTHPELFKPIGWLKSLNNI